MLREARARLAQAADRAGIRERRRALHIARAGSVTLDGHEIPPAEIRLGGHNFRDDHAFLAAARRDAQRLVDGLGVGQESRVLDIGCGVGRLPIGLRAHIGAMPHYTGVDVDRGCVLWCQRHIFGPDVSFIHVDVANERYNPRGSTAGPGFRLPLHDSSFDVIYLYSVFSHMRAEDVRTYLSEFRRLLAPGGGVFLTAFVEDDVEDVAVNPSGYGTNPGEWSGALHCVRFGRGFFESLVSDAGLQIERFDHASDTDGQSAITLRARSARAQLASA
jgi:SAM-dependent methyltransferase